MGNNNSSSGVITLAIIGFVCLMVWWLESRFNATAVLVVIGGILGVLCFAGGALLTNATSKSTMENMAKFAQADAMTDRYRQQSLTAIAKGNSAWEQAQAKMTLMNEKRVHQLADQKARLLAGSQQQQEAETIDAEWWQAPAFDDEE